VAAATHADVAIILAGRLTGLIPTATAISWWDHVRNSYAPIVRSRFKP